MKCLLVAIMFSFFTYSQTIKVSIDNAEINDWGLGKSLALQYHLDSLRIDGTSQSRINEAELTFSDESHSKLVFSEYYDIAKRVVYFNPPKKNITHIKYITGKIEYYYPTIENGDIKIVENPRSLINSRVLKEVSGIEFYMIDIKSLLKIRDLPLIEREIQVQKLIGLSDLSSEFKTFLNNFYQNLQKSGLNQTGALFYIYDPSNIFFTIRIKDKDGELRNPGYASSSDAAWKYFQLFGDSLDQSLAFQFYTKNSVKEFDFKTTNIKIENPNGL